MFYPSEQKNVHMKSTNNNNADYYIKITENGPYLVYGLPSIDEDIIAQDSDGDAWFYHER